MKFTRRKSVILGGATAATIGFSSIVALAIIPDSGGVIHGCYSNYTGSLRVVNSPTKKCKLFETALNWDQSANNSGTVLSNRLEQPVGDPGGGIVLDVPGFGVLKTQPCPDISGNSSMTYTNTTTPVQDVVPFTEADPGQPFEIGGSNVVTSMLIGYDKGGVHYAASVTFTALNPDHLHGCRYIVQAVL